MNQITQGDTSTGLSIHPLKRRRGRPRKDPSLKRTRGPPTYNGPKENGPHSMVGQPVTGVIEATFDAGYLLNIRIGNSTTNFRGLVFKPGHFIPVTHENDVAPHLQMITRNDVSTPVAPPRQKRKYKSRKARVPPPPPPPPPPSGVVPPVGARGNVVPVVLQPVKTGHMMSFGDRDVHMVEPLAILPPDRSVPVGQIFAGPQGGKVGPTESTDTDSMESLGSSDEEEETGNSNEPPPLPFSSESVAIDSAAKPLFNYGTGRMTELLQALQENVKEKKVQQIGEQTASGFNVGFQETRNENESTNGASVP
ncbi:hypothetical protein ABFS83_08G173800 [Erythranthe nasuta]